MAEKINKELRKLLRTSALDILCIFLKYFVWGKTIIILELRIPFRSFVTKKWGLRGEIFPVTISMNNQRAFKG